MKKGLGIRSKDYLSYVVVSLSLIAAFIFVYKTCGFFYAINDDTTMQSLASGDLMGEPDAHLPFIRYPMGLFIAFLFQLCPRYDWYGLTMQGCLFLCYFIYLHRLYRLSRYSDDRIWIILSGIILVILLFMDSAILFQFTMVAGVLAATAVFVMASSENQVHVFDYVLVWILMILAMLIRYKTFLMALPIIALLMGYKMIENLNMGGIYKIKKSSQDGLGIINHTYGG